MHKRDGFTIVELLIVVVVIAILAAITVVAYNGITTRSRVSNAVTGIKQTEKALRMFKESKGWNEWPSDWDTAWGSGGANNPRVADMVANLSEFRQFMNVAPVTPQIVTGTGGFFYDNDNDTYDPTPACTTPQGPGGVNIYLSPAVSNETTIAMDQQLDDGNLNCGKLRLTTGGTLSWNIASSRSE